ncbi:DsbA family protein [Planotetraspora sp. A-T 1434]|uniref:DsbA family protein n=1 Tax=Planotetraspora sp. A-T 1434 TaxID=2979219 RepID=UPI0021C08064|nr:DsbA family protein [Planotetraspora sp. A-T 1434]MCT9934419.1 DsbA family protein [Planotetraspora sp. A-T 1434]
MPATRRRLVQFAVAGVALAVVCVGAISPQYRQPLPTSPSDLITLRPDGTVVMAQAGLTKPLLEVFEDYQCPYCQEFERINGRTVRDAAMRGEIAVIIYPFTIFGDDKPVTRANSHRALMASLCVTDPGKWLAYHDELYAHQPDELAEGGFPIEDLVGYARKVGLREDDFTACLKSPETSERADQVSRSARSHGVEGTPTVRLDGRDIDWSTPWADDRQQTV